MRDINKALEEHKQRVLDAGYREDQIFGIFLYGSQNYGTALENSDVDTKCVLIPDLWNLMFNPIKTKELKLENDEHCEVMDIIHLLNNFKKQNINFLEILFTDYYWINPDFMTLWKILKYCREDIATYDMNKAVQSICGQAIHTLKQNPLDGKKVSNGMRLKYFLENYLDGKDYLDCIKPKDKYLYDIRMFKKQKELSTDKYAKELILFFEQIKTIIVNVEKKESTINTIECAIISTVRRRERRNYF